MASGTVFTDNDYCFACGSKNPLGLQLTFFKDGNSLCTTVNPAAHWQGFEGVLHGGLQSTILDDLMSNLLLRVEGVWATTAEISCRFRKPVPLDQPLLFKAWKVSSRGKIWEIEGYCCIAADPDQTRLTTARARFFEVPRPESC